MKNSKLIQISLVTTVLALAAVSCAPSGNTNTTTNTVIATPEPTPDTDAIVAEITKLENDWPRILRERDAAAVRRLEAEDVMIVYPDGSAGNKEQDVKDIEAGNITFDSWDILDMKVHVIDSDAAVATFLITVVNGKLKTSDGKSQDISGKYRVMDTFARRNSQWQLAASAVTPLSRAAAAAMSASPSASPAATAPATKASPAPKPSPTRRRPPTPAPAGTP